MLYYVEDIEATISFFRSLLHENGKLLVTMLSGKHILVYYQPLRDRNYWVRPFCYHTASPTGESAWSRLPCQDLLYKDGLSQKFTTREIKSILDSKKISYKAYKLPTLLDITECFIPGDEKGQELLNTLTEVRDFSKTAPPEIKDEVLQFLKHPDNNQEENGRILFDTSLEALVIDA